MVPNITCLALQGQGKSRVSHSIFDLNKGCFMNRDLRWLVVLQILRYSNGKAYQPHSPSAPQRVYFCYVTILKLSISNRQYLSCESKTSQERMPPVDFKSLCNCQLVVSKLLDNKVSSLVRILALVGWIEQPQQVACQPKLQLTLILYDIVQHT